MEGKGRQMSGERKEKNYLKIKLFKKIWLPHEVHPEFLARGIKQNWSYFL